MNMAVGEFTGRLPTPHWLARLTPYAIADGKFPLERVLANSLYYPCSGFDGRPLQFLSSHIHSFIYADYGRSRDELLDELDSPEGRVLGYDIVGQRRVSEAELVPQGWRTVVQPDSHEIPPALSTLQQPFCEWIVFQRSEGFHRSHGPSRFSLLYICADGAAAYQALFQKITPKGIAIVQPGTGFGRNYTDYCDPKALFARSVRATGSDIPEIMLNGGIGSRRYYDDPVWPEYTTDLGWLEGHKIHMWGRSSAS